MDERKRRLKGSEKRDIFKRQHKDINRQFYASDAGFCLISKYPPGVVAYLDYKAPQDRITFAETILYNEWKESKPVFIVIGNDPENGPFEIKRYVEGDWRPNPPKVKLEFIIRVANWKEFEQWEGRLRQKYRRNKNGQKAYA